MGLGRRAPGVVCGGMAKPWEVTRDDIEEWADRFPIEATAVLPRLVRRLLFATSPLGQIQIEMRAGGGTRYEGWDGTVRAGSGSAFCPRDFSVWELSVEKAPRKKLDRDYEKRTKGSPDDMRPGRVAYVAVTARAFPGKTQWAAEKSAEGIWREVRAYDIDDLATWIEQAPAVGRWFANLQGRPAYEGRDVEAYLDGWRRRTLPPLPADLVLAGEERRRQSDEVLAWAAAPATQPLTIRGRTREEALVFAAASLAREPGREARLARALVVESEEAYRWVLGVQGASSLMVLPAFEKPDMGQAAAAKVRVILPADKTVPPRLAGMMTLDAQPYPPMAKALEAAGFDPEGAARLIDRAGGDIEALQRLAGYIDGDLPAWARDIRRPEMLALLLAGAWVPTSPGDREVLRRLGADPAVAEQLSADLQAPNVMEREVEHVPRDVLRWTSPDDAWALLGRGITDGLLTRFRDVVMEVLGAPDPAYELPKEERFMAAVKGKDRPESDTLREGLATSILRLSLHDEILAASRGGMGRGRALAEGLLGWLLRGEQGWVIWASLSRLLPILAEACPEVFLSRVEESIDRKQDGVAHLFEEEGGVLGNAPHTGVLWALEVLAWHPEEKIRRRVVLALARLDALDPPGREGRVDNRPLRSLDTLLRYALPASRTTAEERNELLRAVFRQNPETGRKLALGMVRNLKGTVLLHQGAKPRFHAWGQNNQPTDVDMGDVVAQVHVALDVLMADAGPAPERWAKLIEVVQGGFEDIEEKVLTALASHEAEVRRDDTDCVVWRALRRALSLTKEPARERQLRDLYDRLAPPDFARRHAWLFEPYPPLPVTGGARPSEEREQATAKLREGAVRTLWGLGDARWGTLADLVRETRTEADVWNLARTLGKSAFAGELESHVLADHTEGRFIRIVVGFAAALAEVRDAPWLEDLLRRFMNCGRTPEAVQIASSVNPGMPLWKMLEQIGEPLLSGYWGSSPRFFGEMVSADVHYGVERLLRAHNERAALETLAIYRKVASGALALRVLEQLKDRMEESGSALGFDSVDAEYVEWLFDVVDRDPPADKDPLTQIAPLEVFFLPVLADSHRPARYVSLAIAADPGFFAALMMTLYRREGDPPPDEQDPAKVRAAQNAYTLLQSWKGYPGEGLPEEERDQRLEAWTTEVLKRAREEGRGRNASVHVAEVLARAPSASDGDWPCLAARRLLESGMDPELAANLSLAKRNLRGMTGRAIDEGGAQEIEIAERYREASRRMEIDYPRTAAMLDALARRYEGEAERHEARAQAVRIRHGEQPEEEAPPSTPRDPTAPARRGPVSRVITTGVGPAPSFDVPLSPRLNLLIGDNSLGKTFILEVLWWSLTGAWSSLPARPPTRRGNGRAAPAASIQAEAAGRWIRAEYDATKERWKKKGVRSLAPAMALYARADGGFSVWDPIRNAKAPDKTALDLSRGYHFDPTTLFHGLPAQDGITKLCRGLIEDIVSWRSERRRAYAALQNVLDALSAPGDPIKLGIPKRFTVKGAVKHPTLDLGYDAGVFVDHASAAVKRILGLAYLLVWTVTEIQEAAPLAGLAPLDQVTLLIDEVDAHLHPRWQRVILPALLDVVTEIAPSAAVQLIVTTHAPLVLASVETEFDKSRDTLIEFEQAVGNKGKTVRVVEEPLEKLGDVNTWLVERFGFKQPRARKAEEIIERAEAAMENKKLGKREWKALNDELHGVLSDADPFWVSWHYIADKRGWLA